MPVRRHFLILALLFICVHVVMYWHYGIRILMDAESFIEAADFLVTNGKLQDIHHLYYSSPILMMAAFRALFPGEVMPILLFQCLLSGLATIALYKSAEKVFNSALGGLMAGIIFITWIDNIHWNITTMTESIALSAFCFVVYALAHWQDRLRSMLAMAALLAVVFFTRPTSVVIIISALVFFLAYYWKPLLERRPVFISVVVVAICLIILGADTMLAHWDFTGQYLKGNVVTFADIVKGTRAFHETISVEPPSSRAFSESDSPIGRVVMFIYDNPIHFLKTAGLKVFYLTAFVRPYYSWSHNLYLAVWVPLIYLLFVIGWRSTPNIPMKLFVLTAIILNCGLIAISSVDWDNRFYIPMEPGIVLLAGGGAATLFNRLKQRISSAN
ncbi:MAG TPA: glycosyltransferase family 39 protein [Chryseolinea sp.]|nr:glycosyltransferase family 39 protein [Chryseolinea sp.]